MTTWWQDIRYGIRMLFKDFAFTAVAVLTLALVTGAMSLAAGVIRRQHTDAVPFPRVDRIVRLWRVGSERPSEQLPGTIFTEARPGMPGFESLGAIGNYDRHVLLGPGEPKMVISVTVSASVFDVAGVPPLLGRVFTRGQEQSGQRLAVLGHDLWKETFGGDESVIGQTIQLDQDLYTVTGIMPEGFERNALFASVSLWLSGDFVEQAQTGAWLQIVGRMKPGVTRAQVNAQLQAVAWPLGQKYAQDHGWQEDFARLSAEPITKRFGRMHAHELVLAGMIPVLVALIAGFNVTTILLAKMMSRRPEMALRSALGASRGRLLRLLLTESVVMTLGGTLAGLLGAYWLATWTAKRGMPAQFSPSVVGWIALGAAVIGVVVGLLPALTVTHRLSGELQEFGARSGGLARHRLRNFLVGGQVAMTTALCVAAGLLTRSYVEKKRFDPGFDLQNLAAMEVIPRRPPYGDPQSRIVYCTQVLERLRVVPGVQEASVASTSAVDRIPFRQSFCFEGDGATWPAGQEIQLNVVSQNHLGMLNVPVLRGRGLQEQDRSGTEPVLLVSESFARRYFPEGDPIGRRIGMHMDGVQWFTIVGVVPDRRDIGYRLSEGPEGYLSAQQVAPLWASYHFLVRTYARAGPLGTAILEAVRSIDPAQPVAPPYAVESRLRRRVEQEAGSIMAISAVGTFGLLMSMLGIYGVASYAVVERTHEIGVRMSLGATRRETAWLVLRQGLRLVVMGLGVGAVLSTLISMGLAPLLFEVPRFDPATYVGVGVTLAATALLATLMPARRATRIDPMAALRYE